MGLSEIAVPVLAIDLGTINIKVSLFDAIHGQYGLVAAAQAAGGPYSRDFDFYTPVYQAIKSIEAQTSRTFMDSIGRILVPVSEGAGVGRVIITGSAGPPVRVMLVGLLPEGSLGSAARLVEINYGDIVHQVGLHNQMPVEKQIDASINAKPDLIILAGGSEQGLGGMQLNNIEFVRLFCSMLPEFERPKILYAGGQSNAQKAVELLSKQTETRSVPNLRPQYDLEYLDPAQKVFQEYASKVRQDQSETLEYLGRFYKGAPYSAAHSFGRSLRYLSKISDHDRGVLGVNIGTETSIAAVANDGDLQLGVFPYGMGEKMATVASREYLSGIRQWLPTRFSGNKIRDYMWQKSLYPGSIPADSDSLAIEQAVAREILWMCRQKLDDRFPDDPINYGTIIAGGSVLADAPSLGQSLLMILDGLEPAGVTTIYLDPYSIMSSMGAVASEDPVLAVQVLDSFLSESLATVISPNSWAPYGLPILTVQVEGSDEIQPVVRVKKGEIVRLPVPTGDLVTLNIKTGLHTSLDASRRIHSASLQVKGGMLGVVIDGRGRPLRLPVSSSRRWKLIRNWSDSIQV